MVLESYFLAWVRTGLAVVIRIGRPIQRDESVPRQRVEINLDVIRIANVTLWNYRVVRHCRTQHDVARWKRQRSRIRHRGRIAVRDCKSRTVPGGDAEKAEGDNREVFAEGFH